MLVQWRDPVFDAPFQDVPSPLAARLTEMAEEITASEAMPIHADTNRFAELPRGLRIYYERLHVLLAVADLATNTGAAAFNLNEPPSDAELHFGSVLGQAFHQGCSLADVALAAQLPGDQLVTIGRRTIRGTKWLRKL